MEIEQKMQDHITHSKGKHVLWKVYFSISILLFRVKDITLSSGQKKAMGLKTHIIIMKYNHNTKLAIPSFLLCNAKKSTIFKGKSHLFKSLDE